MKASAQTIWVYPYFMERQVKTSDASLAMADLRVTYSSHLQYGETDKARKQGSPVRIFTDIPLSSLELSGAEYYYCDKCRVWRHVSNVHCDTCGTCPSKDGRTYIHCSECGRCVKPTYVHCFKTGRCRLPDTEAPGVKAILSENLKENKKRKRTFKDKDRGAAEQKAIIQKNKGEREGKKRKRPFKHQHRIKKRQKQK